jgi:prepilin-type N-terminal cleavage/methylation domain-containing protein
MKRRAFTLMEILIALAIIALVFTAGFVGLSRTSDEAFLKKPWDELRPLAKIAWMKSLREQNPYQIRFFADRFVMEPRQAIQEEDRQLRASADSHAGRSSSHQEYKLEEGFLIEVRPWMSRDWVRLEKNANYTWIFEQSGLLEPLSVRFTTEYGTVGGRFDPLTASVVEEYWDQETN